jgi:hypothetical protein
MRRVQRNFILLGLALLVSGCGGGAAWGPTTEADRNSLACQGYGFYPGSEQYEDCMRYVENRRGNRGLTPR